jgi:Rod binding domain-containing protein
MQVTNNLDFALPSMPPIALDPRVNPKATPKDAGQAFESMFASILIKQMRQTLGQGQGLFGHDPTDVLGGLFDHFIGQHIAQKGSLGIADMIQKHLDRRSAAT